MNPKAEIIPEDIENFKNAGIIFAISDMYNTFYYGGMRFYAKASSPLGEFLSSSPAIGKWPVGTRQLTLLINLRVNFLLRHSINLVRSNLNEKLVSMEYRER